jgi:hypothetical protein
MNVTIQLYDLDIDNHDGRDAGWWTSADGQRQLDMTGHTVSSAVEELLTQCADADEADAILEGTLEAVVLSVCGDGVEDDSGAVWRPDADAAAEIAASDSPESVMLRICESAPWRGEWRS